MSKTLSKTVLTIFMFSLASIALNAQQNYYYDFRNTFNEKDGQGPALNVLGTGAFADESLPDLSCLERTTYGFTQNSGVQFDNGAAGNFIGNTYSIEAYFKFTNNSGFIRILDYKNRTSDFGLYATSGVLQFYDELTVATTAFVQDQYVHLVVTRDGSSDDVAMYLNGALVGTFVDLNGSALLDGSNVLNFFQDDLVFGGEARPGNIALLKIYNYTLSASEITDSFDMLEETSGVVAFSANTLTSCFSGNQFIFTNESENSGSVSYTWEFGDSNTATGLNATHSYTSDGFFTVLLIADDGNGCTDSTSVEIEIYASPQVDLGLDLDVCDGDVVLLDAGPGFASYLWNDGSTDPDLMVTAGGTYFVEVTDSLGCAASDTIEITIIAIPPFSLGLDTTICFGTTIILSAPTGLDSYLWSTNETTESIVVGSSGVYAVEVTNIEGCTAVDTIEVTINSPVNITLGNDTTICDGQTLTLDPGQNFQSYNWSDGSFSSTLDVTITGVYSVTVTDSFGCTGTSIIQVSVNTAPSVNLGPDITICGGTPLTLDAGAGFSSYFWSDSSSAQTLNVTMAGTYSVVVTDGAGCEGTDEIVVTLDPFITLGNDFSVCDGTTATLDPMSVFITYLWNTGATTPTLDVTVGGIYTLTVTDINGCINFDEIEVTFIPSPVVDLGLDVDICDGDATILDAGAGFSSYLWNDGSSAQTLNVNATGTYTVTVTDINGCPGQDDITVNVNPLPIVVLGPAQSICDGTIASLDAGAGAASYLWNDGSSNQILLVSAAGTYTVTVTNAFNCSASDSITITVNSLPVIALIADTVLCDGDSIVLDAGAGFVSYLWDGGASTQTITASVTGTYIVTVSDANGCTDSDDVDVDFHLPVPTPTISVIGNTLFSSSATGNQWYSVPGGLIAGATGNTYDPPADGTYYVVVTDSNGCVSEPSLDFIFVIDGIASISTNSYTVYPNPTTGMVAVDLNSNITGLLSVDVSDITGKMVHSESIPASGKFRLDFTHLKQGIYFIKIGINHVGNIQKLIITK